MSIQRYDDWAGQLAEDPEGGWVSYADHVAQVETMRQICIAAVEALWTEDPSWDGTNWNNALSCALETIREVQP